MTDDASRRPDPADRPDSADRPDPADRSDSAGRSDSADRSGSAGRSDPAGRSELRASDADREQVAEQLREALAEGRLDMTEFEERLEATYAARTYGDLAPLTRDLPAAGSAAPVNLVKQPVAEGEIDWSQRIGGEPTSTGGFAIWSGFGRKGRWTVGERFTAFVLWGGGEIDLREAHFASREVEIRLFTIMGGINVKVPPELDVTVKGFGIMGGVDDRATGAGTPGSPRVVVRGFALMGGVGVERKLPRAERLRIKDERRREKLERRDERRRELEERRERHGRLHEERLERHRERLEDRLDRLDRHHHRRRRYGDDED
ncbi:DUF1707 domain-containing protein [Streptomyces sp. SID5785]|uniref:DUF1707 SHOCT-like domain-containing protein n=1 Tax=Streptomyces sp. SID5785 TaxID=2690309 RepID=UPI001361A9D3|nr:DUF1707 domain-containing protein [Streptomyces sp. SID5785]MZD07873.1 DUF1707 domain-containing protein [Streptomyces sp. SID5785]